MGNYFAFVGMSPDRTLTPGNHLLDDVVMPFNLPDIFRKGGIGKQFIERRANIVNLFANPAQRHVQRHVQRLAIFNPELKYRFTKQP